MILIKGKLKLYKGKNKRRSAFFDGYRPMFKFIDSTMTSGSIRLINNKKIEPGQEGIVEIIFLNDEYLGKGLSIGQSYKFFECIEPLGEVKILDIMVE